MHAAGQSDPQMDGHKIEKAFEHNIWRNKFKFRVYFVYIASILTNCTSGMLTVFSAVLEIKQNSHQGSLLLRILTVRDNNNEISRQNSMHERAVSAEFTTV